MKIKLFYDDEYVEGKDDYSYRTITVDTWEDFWNLWNDRSDFIRCSNDVYGNIVYLKKDRVILIIEEEKDEF